MIEVLDPVVKFVSHSWMSWWLLFLGRWLLFLQYRWGEHLTDVGPQQVLSSHGNYNSLVRVFLLAGFHDLPGVAGSWAHPHCFVEADNVEIHFTYE